MKATHTTYRRRRIGALLAVLLALVFVLYAIRGADAEPPPTYYTVAPGDTVWSIAASHYSAQEDPRPIVAGIRDANDLTNFRVYPDQRLELPAAD